MAYKKRVVVLVIIALILAVAAISLRILDSNNIFTSSGENSAGEGGTGGEVGVTIMPPAVDDKMEEGMEESS